MLEVAYPNYYEEEDYDRDDPNKDNTNAPPPRRKQHQVILPYATKVADDDDNNNTTSTKAMPTWPVSPSAEKVGEFKVSPSIHVGYAITWYGLSMAGLYMTRLLLLKR